LKPTVFDAAIPRDADGNPILVFMTDPDGADAFVSLVDKGANLRRISVAKRDGTEVQLSGQGTTPAQGAAWYARIFGPLLGLLGLGMASKSEGAVTFDAAIGVPQLWERIWDAQDALRTVIRNVLEDAEITDKKAKITEAIGAFARYLESEVGALPTAKRDQAAIAEASALVRRIAKQQNAATLAGLPAAVSTTPSRAEKAEEEPMTQAMILALATAGAAAAVQAAKAADPALTAERLAAVQTDAFATIVAKVAVAGPKQVDLPSNLLDQQQAQSKGASGTFGGDASGKFAKALGKLDMRAVKVEKALFGGGEADDAEPGILDILSKVLDRLDVTDGLVRKMAGTPAKPKSDGGGNPKKSAKKDDDTDTGADDFAGSALSGWAQLGL